MWSCCAINAPNRHGALLLTVNATVDLLSKMIFNVDILLIKQVPGKQLSSRLYQQQAWYTHSQSLAALVSCRGAVAGSCRSKTVKMRPLTTQERHSAGAAAATT